MRKSIWKMFALASLIMFNACSEEEPQAPAVPDPDTEKPVITVLAPSDITKPLRATVTVRAEATDNTGIAKVEVFVNGASIASATSSPVEVSWDTKTVNDGTHQIKIVAEDTEGNTEEKVIQVEVKNILFSFLIGPEYVSAGERGWIFVSDQDGVIIDTQEMVNGDQLNFYTPEGFDPDDQFTFHRFEYLLEDLGVSTFGQSFIVSYTGLLSGNYIMNDGTPTKRTSIGTHTINVSNIPAGPPSGPPFIPQITSFNSRFSSMTGSNSERTLTIDLFETPAKVIVGNLTSATLFEKFEIEAAEVGGTTNIDYTDLSEFDFTEVPVGDHIGESISLTLVPISNDYVNTTFFTFLTRNFTSPTSDPIKVYSPNLNPVEFITSLGFVDLESITRRYTVAASSIPSEVKTITADITSVTENNGVLEVEANGDFQYVSVYSEIFDTDESGNSLQFSWSVFADKSSIGNIPKPQFPESLNDLYPDIAALDLTFDYVSLFKNVGIDNYLDWVDDRYSGERIFKFSKEQFQISKSFAPPGGRVGNSKIDPFRGADIPKSERHK